MSEETKKKVLVVEDETDLREALVVSLEDEGFTVIEASDGVTGLKYAMQEKPDLMLLDIMMPQMNGHEVLARLRQDEWGQTAKVIVLSAVQDMESVSTAMEHDTYEYLVKSDWKLGDIVARVKTRLS